MLYDPKWNKIPTLHGLIAWLETQDPTTTYDFRDTNGCLVCAYYNALGINGRSNPDRPLYGDTFGPHGSEERNNYGRVACRRPWTFGAALERAREIAAR